MKNSNLKTTEYLFAMTSFVVYATLSFIIFQRGVIFSPDSNGYLVPTIIRSPIYPLFINICRLIAGTHYLTLLILSQIAIGLASITVFCSFLFKQFNLNKWIVLSLSFILFSPYLFGMQIGNIIGTEPLAYPLYLITFKYILEAFNTGKFKKFALAFCWATVLILTRSQFLFLYPLILIIILYFLVFTGMNKKSLLKISIVFSVFIIGCISLEMTYHKLTNDKFIRTPFLGIQLVTNALYVSESKDSVLFKPGTEKEIFIKIIKEAERKKLTLSTFANNAGFSYIHHYDTAYNELCWRTMFPILQSNIKHNDITDLYIQADKLTLSISKQLIYHNWREFLSLYAKNIYNGLGGFLGFTWSISTFFCLMFTLFLGNRSNELMFLIIISICNVFNYMLVALVEPIMLRYSFYTEIILIVFITSILFSYIEKTSTT